MGKKLTGHLISLVLALLLGFSLIFYFDIGKKAPVARPDSIIKPYIEMDMDLDDPLRQALFKDMVRLYHPEESSNPDSLLRAVLAYRRDMFEAELQSAQTRQVLNQAKLRQLGMMFLKYVIVYILVLWLTYYGVETLGLIRFIRRKQNKVSYIFELINFLKDASYKKLNTYWRIPALLVKSLLRGLLYLVFFSPAYVIAYSIKTEFNTNTLAFLILLGLISNGLLITYTNKFYAFLIAESRKGYVLTAMVKNLSSDYRFTQPHGVSLRALFSMRKRFKNHVLNHIYLNAHYQYLGTFKEQASFLISGLIIIEMALNIHGHLSYELLQQLLYKNYDIVIVIVMSIFFIVKVTEILTDWVIDSKRRIYENRNN